MAGVVGGGEVSFGPYFVGKKVSNFKVFASVFF